MLLRAEKWKVRHYRLIHISRIARFREGLVPCGCRGSFYRFTHISPDSMNQLFYSNTTALQSSQTQAKASVSSCQASERLQQTDEPAAFD
jgi:hypothetical protein